MTKAGEKIVMFSLFIGVLVVYLAMLPACDAFDATSGPDLAIGVTHEAVGSIYATGIVNVLYSGDGGLGTTGNEYFSQDSTGILDTCEDNDAFGKVLTTGDFNGDGYLDLVVGIPMEDVGSVIDAGAVQIIYGSVAGLTATTPDNQFLTQSDTVATESPEQYDYFGAALAAGDFDNDGFDDLVVGAPGEDIEEYVDAGLIIVFPGSSGGLLTGSQSDKWTQNTGNLLEEVGKGDKFGFALDCGDVNGDGFADLVIGAPGEGVRASERYEGCVHVMFGTYLGLRDENNQCLWQGKDDQIMDQPDYDDNFGSAVILADFNGDGYDDLAVTAANESLEFGEDNIIVSAGMVSILYGGAFGISTINDGAVHQEEEPYPGTTDHFGQVLEAGDINGDGYSDLIIGAPYDELGSIEKCGSFYIYWGSHTGISAQDYSWHYQGDGIVPGEASDFDYFPSAVACADFNQDGFDDIAIGSEWEDLTDPNPINIGGVVYVVRGSPGGLIATGAQTWHQDIADVAGAAEDYDHFGSALAASVRRDQDGDCNQTGVNIWMPGTVFGPGEICGCVATVCNTGASTLNGYPLFVILEIAGAYYCAPSFSPFDNYLDQHPGFPPGETTVVVLPGFEWPEGVGTYSGCVWYGALTNPQITDLFGTLGTWTFGWTQ